MNRDENFERETREIFVDNLVKTLRTYREGDEVRILGTRDKFCAFYGLGGIVAPRENGTWFDLIVENEVCDLASINLSKELRGYGVGRDIYQTIENFSREIGLKEVIVYASKFAKSISFWPHMGMTPKRESPGMIIMHKEL